MIPLTGFMTNPGAASHEFGLGSTAVGQVRGKVFRDNNRNGVFDSGETGFENVFVSVVSNGGTTTQGFAHTDASGDYTITTPANSPPGTNGYYVTITPPSGFFATSSTALGPLYLTSGQTINGKNFGVTAYQVISLAASRVLSLASLDLQERDWVGSDPATAHADADIVLGADAGGTDNISVWFNLYNSSPLFSNAPSSPNGYTRNAPQSVLAMALDSLDLNAPRSRPDLVTGTKSAVGGNFFIWFNQNSSDNEGYFPTTYSPGKNYQTQDQGDVQAVLTMDCAGGSGPDIIVGTRSLTAGRGTIEIWQNNDVATPSFSRQETYPSAGNIPLNQLGEVTAMKLADVNADGRRDLIVATRTGIYSGELLVFKNVGNTNGNRFLCAFDLALDTDAATSIACTDVDLDGYPDIVLGTQDGASSGNLLYFHNEGMSLTVDFQLKRKVNAPGIVTALAPGDFGGLSRTDLAVGWRADASGYGGGVLIYYLDAGTLPPSGTDPSSGLITSFVPALTTSNFNYGVYPSVPAPPFLTDVAAGVKTGPTTGAVYVFIR